MSYIHRRELEALGMPIGTDATHAMPGTERGAFKRLVVGGGGGGGGDTTSTVTNYSIPDWLRPQTEALLGGATQEFFQTSGNKITGVKPYTPYSSDPRDYVAGFSPLQQQTQEEAANMTTPGQFAGATDLTNVAGAGALSTINPAGDYGQLGAMYGGLGSDFGAQGAQMGMQAGLDGSQALGYGGAGFGYGMQGAQAGLGLGYQMTDPSEVGRFMDPYMQNVVDIQKDAAIQDAQVANLSNNLAASRQGTYGGARNLLTQSEASRNLQGQLSDIQLQGQQRAYQDAIRNQQSAAQAAMQGAQTGMQGAQTGIQGVDTYLRGAQTGMQGAQLGMQGAQAGMQGAQIGLQGVGAQQAGFGQAGQAGQQLAGIGAQQQQSDLDRLQAQTGIGAQQQQHEQSIIDQAIHNYGMADSNAQRMLEAYSALLHGYASPTVTQTTQTPTASMGSQLAGLGMSGMALAGMGGKAQGGLIKRPQGIDTLAIRKASGDKK